MFKHIIGLGLPWHEIEKFVQELAWRDYFQQVWIAKKEGIKQDLKNKQSPVSNYQIPKPIVESNTGIEAVDQAIRELYATGYMHNHMRMYVASVCCNVANSHWLAPANWMYSHLLDGDLASNYLSWQWVAGTFSNKKYYANQQNINTFFNSTQRNTFLDVDYGCFETMDIPGELVETVHWNVAPALPKQENSKLIKNKTTLVYNYYNIDPYWHKGEDVQRVFLMEPSFFEQYPVSRRCMDFALELTKNIEGIQMYIGEFSDLKDQLDSGKIIYKEHPTNVHYLGFEEARYWLSSIVGYFPSFFSFWKKCKKELLQQTPNLDEKK